MSDVQDVIPRSTMTTAQQRRIGALQAAKNVLQGNGYRAVEDVTNLLDVAQWIEGSQS